MKLLRSLAGRRLLALRLSLVGAYVLALPFVWYVETSTLFSRHIGEYTTGWRAGYGEVALWLAAAWLVAWVRYGLNARWTADIPLRLVDVGVSLYAVFGHTMANLFGGTMSEQIPYRIAQAALVLSLAASVRALFERRAAPAPSEGEAAAEPADPRGSGEDSVPDAARELVLVIHGTGSAAESDEGSSWWQVGGAFVDALNEALRPGLRVHRRGEAFRWSGANLESHRRAAGTALAAHLRVLAGKWERIHLVGHSHGGSVAWHALRELRDDRALDRVGKVVTLGTPFLRLERAEGLRYYLLGAALLGLLLASASGYLSDAVSVGAAVWLSVQGVVIAAVVAFLALAMAALACVAAVTVRRGYESRREHAADRETLERLGGRLHCLWSRHDEAINGLGVTTVSGGGLLVSPLADEGERGFWTAPFHSLYHDMLGPLLDQALWLRTSRSLQGSDILGARIASVSPHPVRTDLAEELPGEVRDAIGDWVATHSSTALRRAREALGVFWATGTSVRQITQAIGGHLTGRELVHWSYYQAPGSVEIVVRLLTGKASVPLPRGEAAPATPLPPRRQLHSLRVKAGVAAGLLAAAGLAVAWTTLEAWHRVQVYPRTARFAAVASVLDAPLDAAEDEGSFELLSDWFRVAAVDRPSATSGSLAGASGDQGLLLAFERLQPPRRGVISFGGPKVFWSACRSLYESTAGGDAAAARSRLVAMVDSGAAGHVATAAGAVTPDLLRRLQRRGASYLRSCLAFDPGDGFFLPQAAYRSGSFFNNRANDADTYVAAAIYLARAWALDPAIRSEILPNLGARADTEASGGDGEPRHLAWVHGRVDAWPEPDLAELLLSYGDSASVAAATHILHRAMEGEDDAARAAAARAVCGNPAPFTTGEESPAGAPVRWAAWRCVVEAGARRGAGSPAGSSTRDSLEHLLALAAARPGAVLPDDVLREATELADWHSGFPVRSSRIRCDAALLAARAGRLAEARLASEQCTVATDRLRVMTEIVRQYSRSRPGVKLQDLLDEAVRMVPGRAGAAERLKARTATAASYGGTDAQRDGGRIGADGQRA